MSVAADCRALATDLAPAVRAALGVTARDAKTRFQRVAAVAAGGDSRLSRVGRKGTKIGARYDVVDDTLTVVKATGPWQFVEYPRRGGYPIPARKGRGPNRKRARARLLVGGEWVTGPIVGGAIARPEGPWHRATPEVVEAAGDRIVGDLLKAIDRHI